MISVSVRHNFETGHRLPQLPGKCQSLHGHSWWVTVTVEAEQLDAAGMVVDFGALKLQLRAWIDKYLDHGLMLGWQDPLLPVLREHGKTFTFRPDDGDWPTVENVAQLLGRVAGQVVADLAPAAHVARVAVQEKHDNEASWTA